MKRIAKKHESFSPFNAVDQERRDRAVLDAMEYMKHEPTEPFWFSTTGDMLVFAFRDGEDIEVYETTVRRQVTF